MKVCVTGDFHWLGQPDIPDCDLLLLHGDLGVDRFSTTRYAGDEQSQLIAWLDDLQEREIAVVAIAGNHDHSVDPLAEMESAALWTFLHDRAATVKGMKVWGSPWAVKFLSWPWTAPEHELAARYAAIPDDVEIIVSHGPPYGHCDLAQLREHAGSRSLLERAMQLPNLRLIACGHIHEGYGITYIPGTNTENKHAVVVANGSYVDGGYHPGNPPIVLDL